MICPFTDKICTDPDCKQDGCLEQRDDDGEDEVKDKNGGKG